MGSLVRLLTGDTPRFVRADAILLVRLLIGCARRCTRRFVRVGAIVVGASGCPLVVGGTAVALRAVSREMTS